MYLKHLKCYLVSTILIVISISFIFIQVLSGCHKQMPYHAIIYGNVNENRRYLNKEFYENNLTEGAYSEEQKSYVSGESYPKERTVIIDNEIDFNNTFKEFPLNVDFNKSILILHCFTTSSSSEYVIKNVEKVDESVIINYTRPVKKYKSPPNATMPLAKWVIVIIDKLDFETAQFIFC